MKKNEEERRGWKIQKKKKNTNKRNKKRREIKRTQIRFKKKKNER